MMIQQALQFGMQQLDNVDTPDIDSDYLLCHVLDCESHYLRTWPEKTLTQQQLNEFKQLLARRQQGMPVAYLIGQRGFWTLDLTVNEATLIPRPDTEIMVSTALDKVQANMLVLDIGTGSGAIALALASERSDIRVLACDRSAQALAVAEANRRQHGLDHVAFWQGDWLQAIRENSVNLIVSNPPYIADTDPHLMEGDVRYEPKSALVAHEMGLADIWQICEQATTRLMAKGWLMVEHGYQQGAAVREKFHQLGYQQISSIHDYGGHERVTIGQLPV